MSYIGIMSRGYILPVVPETVLCDRPTISGSSVLAPAISGASQGPVIGPPTIRAADAPVPELRGAEADPPATPPDPPSITGGSLLAPVITSGKED